MEEHDIRCFQHCDANVNLFCFNLPDKCPLCCQEINQCSFLVPPFCLPNPFCFHMSSLITSLSASNQPIKTCSVIIKPTNGYFLSSYSGVDDLHVGVTDSEGVVYSYDETGVRKETASWDGSLCVEIISTNDVQDDFIKQWNCKLNETLTDRTYSKSNYHLDDFNCYNYVISFLSSILKLNITKKKFCEHHLLPTTSRAAKYISLYRELEKEKIVMKDAIY